MALAFTLATNIIAQRRAVASPEAGPSTQVAEEHDEGEGADVMCQSSLCSRAVCES